MSSATLESRLRASRCLLVVLNELAGLVGEYGRNVSRRAKRARDERRARPGEASGASSGVIVGEKASEASLPKGRDFVKHLKQTRDGDVVSRLSDESRR